MPLTQAHIQHTLGVGGAYWMDPLQAWPASMAQPWELVLGMALPIIDRVDIRVRREEGIFRGHDLFLGGIPGTLLQRRVRQGEAAPWTWLAHCAIAQQSPNPPAAFPFFLDVLGERFRRLEGREISQAIGPQRLAGAMSGKIWALLGGRVKASELLNQAGGGTPGT